MEARAGVDIDAQLEYCSKKKKKDREINEEPPESVHGYV